jgi:hypothetical protein
MIFNFTFVPKLRIKFRKAMKVVSLALLLIALTGLSNAQTPG